MSDRGHFRGRGGGRGGAGAHSSSDHRGGRNPGRGGAPGASQAEKPKKENILDLAKYLDKQINVKFNGGREGSLARSPLASLLCLVRSREGEKSKEAKKAKKAKANRPNSHLVVGVLKGYDQLMNLVLDDVQELLRGTSCPCSHLPSLSPCFVPPPPLAPLRPPSPPNSIPTNQISPQKPHLTASTTNTDDDGNSSTRPLGLIVARGTLLVLLSPVDGSEQIENPFNVADE